MKEVASSIIVLAAVLLLISAEHFDSIPFWILGTVMLIDGSILFVLSTLFPKSLSSLINRVSSLKV